MSNTNLPVVKWDPFHNSFQEGKRRLYRAQTVDALAEGRKVFVAMPGGKSKEVVCIEDFDRLMDV